MSTSLLRASLLLAACASLLAGCLPASNPVKSEPAEPQLGAFRYEQITRNEGLRGDFAFELQDKVTTAADRQRVDSSFKFTGYILGRLLDSRDSLTITRLDRDLVWTISSKDKRYTEMPLGKLGDLRFQLPKDDPKGETVYVEDCCRTTTSVRRTGAKKIVNGFEAEQVMLTVSSQCSEQIGEPNTTVIKMEVWISPDAKFGPEVAAFEQALMRKAGFDIDAARAMGDQMMSLFPAAKELFALLKGLQGMPVYWVLTVEDEQFLKQKAAAKAKTAEKSDTPRSVSDAVFSFGSKLVKDRQDAKEKENDLKWGNVIFRVTWEVRNFEKASVGQSTFELAAGLAKVENEQQLEGGKATQTQIEHKPARYVPTQCLATLDQAKLGVPLPPKSIVARSTPYDHGDHNTKYHYTGRGNYRVLFGSPDTPADVVKFYEGALKVKCAAEGSGADKVFVCRKGTQAVRISEKPVEVAVAVSGADMMQGEVESRRVTGFEISSGK